MPHLLIAGATGSGKSVAINAMIMSILYKAPPRDVRFVMIDLKMLELSVYEDIPHLLVPVVTDPKQAVVRAQQHRASRWTERYRLMKEQGVRNIDSYNKLIDETRAEEPGGSVIELDEEVADDADDDEVAARRPAALPERLPQIVVIIDELADLMMTMGREVEEPITRLAQKARAAGIHLILATQRPSVDVITGPHQGELSRACLVPGDGARRLAHHPRPDRRRAPARRAATCSTCPRAPRACSVCTDRWSPRRRSTASSARHQATGHAAVRVRASRGRPRARRRGGVEADDLSDALYDQAVRARDRAAARRRSRGCSGGCASATTAPRA